MLSGLADLIIAQIGHGTHAGAVEHLTDIGLLVCFTGHRAVLRTIMFTKTYRLVLCNKPKTKLMSKNQIRSNLALGNYWKCFS